MSFLRNIADTSPPRAILPSPPFGVQEEHSHNPHNPSTKTIYVPESISHSRRFMMFIQSKTGAACTPVPANTNHRHAKEGTSILPLLHVTRTDTHDS